LSAGDCPGNAILAHAIDHLHALFQAPGRPDKRNPPPDRAPTDSSSHPTVSPGSPYNHASPGNTDAPATPVTPVTHPQGALLHGDCLEVMQRLPSGSIKAVVTSPPYNLRNSTGNGMRDGRGGKWEQAALLHGYATHLDAMPHAAYVGWQRRCLAEMMRLLRPDGAIFYNHKWRVQNGLLQDRQDIVAGFPVRQVMIWHRSGGINFNPGYFLPNYEVIYLIAKKDFTLAPKANALGCVWRISQRTGTPHPAPFPPELVENCLTAVEDGPILDPFVGSGTTALVADRRGLDWIGIDVSETYLDMAAKRIAAARRGEE
jgi:site-specific DNA-methyltransferase (adenine-specific)